MRRGLERVLAEEICRLILDLMCLLQDISPVVIPSRIYHNMKTGGNTVACSNASWRKETFVFVNRRLRPARRMYPRSSRRCELQLQLWHETHWNWGLVIYCSLKTKFHKNSLHQAYKTKTLLGKKVPFWNLRGSHIIL